MTPRNMIFQATRAGLKMAKSSPISGVLLFCRGVVRPYFSCTTCTQHRRALVSKPSQLCAPNTFAHCYALTNGLFVTKTPFVH